MDKRVREAIEACRSDDLQSPEMAEAARQIETDPQARLLLAQVGQWDAAISRSLDEVVVPPGLAGRILDRLRAVTEDRPAGGETQLLAESVATATAEEPSPAGATAQPPGRARSRRYWIGVGASVLAASLLVAAAGVFWLRRDRDVTIEALAEGWNKQLTDDWKPIAEANPDFAPPSAIRVSPQRWQWIDRFSATRIAAYELVHKKAGKAMLYVAHVTRSDVPGAPPLVPRQITGGKAIAYWQSGSRLYVLVVDDERNYPAFVRSSSSPLA